MTDTKITDAPHTIADCTGNEFTVFDYADCRVTINGQTSATRAAHIVKCVNMYEELVGALKEAGDVIESYYKSTGIDLGDASNMPFYDDTIRKIDETLKKAGAL